MKIQLGPTDILFPIPVALIGCGTFDEPNIITVASIGMLSSTPPTIGISIVKSRYSLELIRKTGGFTVNIPMATQLEQVDFCGIVSGEAVDQFHETAFHKMKSHTVNAPIIEDCPFNIECRVMDEIVLGDYVLILGEVVETHVNHDVAERDGLKTSINIDGLKPLVYCSTIREYRRIGKKLGDGFIAGLSIKGGMKYE